MGGQFSNCCCGGGIFESKLLAVEKPWGGFWDAWVNATTWLYRYEVQTEVNTNSSGSRTTVLTYDHDNGELDTSITDTPGFNPALSTGGIETSHVITETVDSLIYPSWSIVKTLSVAVTMATVAGEAQAVLDAWIDTWDMKGPFIVSAYFAGDPVDVLVAFPSELLAFPGGGLPAADMGNDMVLLSPRGGMFPWDGTYEVIFADAGLRNYYYAQYGWSSDIHLGPLYVLNSLQPGGGPESNPHNWKLLGSFIVCSKTCFNLPNGLSCASPDVTAIVINDMNPTSEFVADSTCYGFDLSPGFYCFSQAGIYEAGNSTPITDSYTAPTGPGFMVATVEGMGGGSFFLNATGPLPWTIFCCP